MVGAVRHEGRDLVRGCDVAEPLAGGHVKDARQRARFQNQDGRQVSPATASSAFRNRRSKDGLCADRERLVDCRRDNLERGRARQHLSREAVDVNDPRGPARLTRVDHVMHTMATDTILFPPSEYSPVVSQSMTTTRPVIICAHRLGVHHCSTRRRAPAAMTHLDPASDRCRVFLVDFPPGPRYSFDRCAQPCHVIENPGPALKDGGTRTTRGLTGP
jgi:hypothetical protein